jgi:hypothetical protein
VTLVQRATTKEFDNLDAVGVSIIPTDANQLHCGFVFKFQGAVRHLHLAWHHRLEDDTATIDITFVNLPALDPINRLVVVAQLSQLKQNGLTIPYGFSLKNVTYNQDFTTLQFESDGTFAPLPKGVGLTCATFVLVTMESLGLRLIDEDTWPSRDEDKAWQAHIVGMLEARASEHAAALKSNIGLVRVRPDEVAGAGTEKDWPVEFQSANRLARQILSELAAA